MQKQAAQFLIGPDVLLILNFTSNLSRVARGAESGSRNRISGTPLQQRHRFDLARTSRCLSVNSVSTPPPGPPTNAPGKFHSFFCCFIFFSPTRIPTPPSPPLPPAHQRLWKFKRIPTDFASALKKANKWRNNAAIPRSPC